MNYTVRPGDTLAEIARRFGVPLETLAQLNQIENVHQIHVGQQLLIPDDADPIDREPIPSPRPIARQYAIRRVNNLLLTAFANKSRYRRGETVVLYLIKVNIGNSPISLHYRTTQRFDFTATNEQEWTWSRGRAFAYVQEDVVIEPGESKIFRANWDQEANDGTQMIGNIDITAWNVASRLDDERLTFSINIE
ncbi:BsuPI-related putative proteinase inhibitor [Natronospora cellulosivora (SeqCode)]